MKHNHSCTCDHDNVKYCKKCKVVHCLECNQEWRTYPIYTYTYPYWQYGQYSGGVGYAGQPLQSNGAISNTNTLDDGHINLVASCTHGA